MIHELLWRITYRCNKKCPFCFNTVFEDKVNFEIIENNNVRQVLNFVEKHNIEKVYISGGEPTLVKQLPDIIDSLATLTRVIVFTNGLLFKKYTPVAISNLPISAINVSIDQYDILNTTSWFVELLRNIREVKNLNSNIKINTQLMIDKNYFLVTNHSNFYAL